jgi:hypothetical protein
MRDPVGGQYKALVAFAIWSHRCAFARTRCLGVLR